MTDRHMTDRHMTDPDPLRPDAQRLNADVTDLAAIHAPDGAGWTRTVFSEPYRASRDWVRSRMRDAGLDVHADGAGNLVGVLPGRDPSKAALMTGSHTDTVRDGGRFDGVVGVVGSLEAVRLLRERGVRLERDLLVVDFIGEESNEYGLSCLGSRALAGGLTAEHLDRVDRDGVRLGDRYAGFGIDPSAVLAAPGGLPPRGLHRYVELHIEQGPVLEDGGSAIGVVTAIAGIRRLVAEFVGRADHAGTTPMTERRDALAAAAAAVLSVRQEGCGAPVHGVTTTSRLDAAPGSPNVVPANVRMHAEMRSTDVGWLSDAQLRLATRITEQAAELGVDADLSWVADNECVPAHADVHDTISSVCDALGVGWTAIPSGATHDAAHMAALCPMGMIFVPSAGGRSHCPEEWTDLDDIVTGVRVHAETLLALDRA